MVLCNPLHNLLRPHLRHRLVDLRSAPQFAPLPLFPLGQAEERPVKRGRVTGLLNSKGEPRNPFDDSGEEDEAFEGLLEQQQEAAAGRL